MLDNLRAVLEAVVTRDLLLAVLVAVILSGGGIFLGRQNNGVVPVSPDQTAHYHAEPHHPLTFMANWDAPDYITISRHGYQSSSQTNFFPLYPLLIRGFNTVLASFLWSAFAVAWLGFVGAVFFYLKVVKRLYQTIDNHEALWAVLLFVLFPTGVFLFAPYTEGPLGFLALGAIYYALRKRWLPAAILTMFATAVHITGVFVLILMGLLLLEEGISRLRALAAVALGSLGLLSYMLYLQLHFHNALNFVSAQKEHGWLQHKFAMLPTELSIINGLIILALLVAVVYWWSRRKSFAVYTLLFLCIPAVGGQLGGFNRYALMAFPVQLMLYEYCRRKPLVFAIVLVVTTILWTHYLLQYAGGYIGG
jgi:mannosyltransferase PIG-V